MNFHVKVDLSRALKSVTELKGNGKKAIASALNKTMAMAKTAGEKEIRTIYNLKTKDFKYKSGGSKVVVNKAFPNKLITSLYIKGHRMGFYLFGARQNKRTGLTSVEIKRGHRFTLKHAFIAPWRKGQSELWVMETDKSKGKTIERISPTSGKTYKTYPRKALFTISLPEFFKTRRVAAAITNSANKNFNRIFLHEFLARVKGFVKTRKAA